MTHTAYYDLKIGKFKIKYTDTHIVSFKPASVDINLRLSQPSELSDCAAAQVREYLEGRRTVFELPVKMQGTYFQMKVWEALCDIPYGETRTYKQIAIAIGNPKAARAVGMANNKNPISIIVPCHRVIGSSGKLVGYAGGLEMKQFLLKLEHENLLLATCR